MTPGGWGQIAVVWIVAGVLVGVMHYQFRRYVRVREAKAHLRDTYARHRQITLDTQELRKAEESDIQESRFQQRARTAEALGFLEPDDAA